MLGDKAGTRFASLTFIWPLLVPFPRRTQECLWNGRVLRPSPPSNMPAELLVDMTPAMLAPEAVPADVPPTRPLSGPSEEQEGEEQPSAAWPLRSWARKVLAARTVPLEAMLRSAHAKRRQSRSHEEGGGGTYAPTHPPSFLAPALCCAIFAPQSSPAASLLSPPLQRIRPLCFASPRDVSASP